PLVDLHVKPFERVEHGLRGLGQMQPELRMLMDPPPERHRARQQFLRPLQPNPIPVHQSRSQIVGRSPPLYAPNRNNIFRYKARIANTTSRWHERPVVPGSAGFQPALSSPLQNKSRQDARAPRKQEAFALIWPMRSRR